MDPGEVGCQFTDEIGYPRWRELRFPIDVLNDDARSGKQLGGLIEVVRLRHWQSEGMQYLQDLEVIPRNIRVSREVDSTVPAHDYSRCLTVSSANLKRRYLR